MREEGSEWGREGGKEEGADDKCGVITEVRANRSCSSDQSNVPWDVGGRGRGEERERCGHNDTLLIKRVNTKSR